MKLTELKLKKFLTIFKFYSLQNLYSLIKTFFKKKKKLKLLSPTIEEQEKIARSFFTPMNIHKSKKTLLNNTFRTPPNKDEVSVNRLDYTNLNFCKKVSKKIEQPQNKRSYFGIAIIKAKEIFNLDCDILYTPITEPESEINLFHSDIKIGYSPKKGVPLPSKYQFKINALTKAARLYVDPNPELENWCGDNLE